MIKKFFKVKLLSDVVLNASLATEGNMETLDYLPGSVFLGVVAKEIYRKNAEMAYDILHSGKVSFGDAMIEMEGEPGYAMPFCLFTDKLKKDVCRDVVYVHHANPDFSKIKQPVQVRSGFFSFSNHYFSGIKKRFALKSAQDRNSLRSADGKMYGFESIMRGQEFIFSVSFDDDRYVDVVTSALTGVKRIGKSKNTQYGLVDISELKDVKVFSNGDFSGDFLVVYAESNLCLMREGQPTLRPEAKDFGLSGEILWGKSQIRTYSYSPWNIKNNTSLTQRHVILKGSVIVVRPDDNDYNFSKLPLQIGVYTAEGLGRVIYNPDFLGYDDEGKWTVKLTRYETKVPSKYFNGNGDMTSLGKLLRAKKDNSNAEVEIGRAVLEFVENKSREFKGITPSQWGVIREYANRINGIDSLIERLFDEENGVLRKGVAALEYWDKGRRRASLRENIEVNKKLGVRYVAKLAAEMAKKSKKDHRDSSKNKQS